MDNLQVLTTVVPEPSGLIRLALVMVDAAIELSRPCAEHHFGRLGAIAFFFSSKPRSGQRVRHMRSSASRIGSRVAGLRKPRVAFMVQAAIGSIAVGTINRSDVS